MSEPTPRRWFRVDPRLVHATLVSAWLPKLKVEVVVVVDATLETHPRKRAIYELAAQDAAELVFTEPRRLALTLAGLDERAVMVVFASLDDVSSAMDYGLQLRALMIGHLPKAPQRRAVHPAVYLGAAESRLIHALRAKGVAIWVQALPEDPAIDVSTLDLPKPLPQTQPSVPLIALDQAPSPSGGATALEAELCVVNERGLHLRAAHVLADTATRARSEVRVGFEGNMANAKSLLGLTALGATKGTRLKVWVSGPDAEATLDTLTALFESGFHEGRDD